MILRLQVSMAAWHMLVVVLGSLLLFGHCNAARVNDESPSASLNGRSDRASFDSMVSTWKNDNPHLADTVSKQDVENIWLQVSGQVTPKAQSSPAKPKNLPHDDTPRLASSSSNDVSNARKVVRGAIRQASSFSKQHTTVHRNSYKLKPDEQIQARAKASSFTPSTQQKHAAALVAEADARDRKANGTLHRQYRIPMFKNDGKMPSYYTHQDSTDLSKRDGDDYWLATVGAVYPGNFPYGGSENDDYKVYRNVKDYGAKGDGAADDTFALLVAMYDGNRCGADCGGTTVKGATVYFPPGTYLVSSPIIALYNTQLVGHPKNLPIIRAAASFTGLGVFTSDVYIDQGNGETWYLNTANFLRQIRNFVIDTQDVEVDDLKVLHWQVAQATSLQNIHIYMKPGSSQIGLFIENGSGGTLDSISIDGGAIGINCGNQQFTSKNIIISGSNAGISMLWDWGWTWQSLFVTQTEYGIKFQTSDFVGGSLIVLDSLFYNVKNAIYIDQKKDSLSLSVKNIQYGTVGTLIQSKQDGAVLAGGSGLIDNWLLGTSYHAPDYKKDTIHGKYSEAAAVPDMPAHQTSSGAFFTRTKPQYENIPADQFFHFGKDDAKTLSDGQHDSTGALSLFIAASAAYKRPFYLAAGSYIVTDTLKVPPGAIIVGSCWSQLIASGEKFSDMNNPKVMVQVGEPGSIGSVEISDILFTVKGPTAGAVLVEWNLSAAQQGSAAMWDSHFRVGGAAGSDLQKDQCPKLSGSVNKKCIAASLLLHLTPKSNAYLDNIWAWTADHDLDDPPKSETQIDVYSARGILIESRQATWLYGTSSEHNVLYQYSLSQAANVYMAMIQTESPYYLPHPPAPAPFESAVGKFSNDPDFKDCKDDSCRVSWALYLTESYSVFIAGAGLYSWFYGNYDRSCVNNQSCQQRLVRVDDKSNIIIYSLYTVGAKEMVSQGSLPAVPAKGNLKINQDPYVSIIATYNKRKSNFLGSGGVFFEGGPPDDTFGNCKTTSDGAVGLIDWWLKEKLNDGEDATFNWETRMFMLFGGDANSGYYCNSLSKDMCNPEVHCDDKLAASKPNYANAYWAVKLLQSYFTDTKGWKNYILQKLLTRENSLAIDVAADFPVDDPEPNDGFSKALEAFGKAVGLGQLGLSHGGEDAKAVGGYLGEFGSVVGAISGFLSSSQNDTKPNIQNIIEIALDKMGQLIGKTADFSMTHYFGKTPRMDDFPKSVFPKNTGYTAKAAQFLGDGRYSLHGTPDIPENHQKEIEQWLNSTAVTVALMAEKYYVIVDFYSKAACNPDRDYDDAVYKSARWIDGHCYALHKPGPGFQGETVTDPGVYTREVDGDRLKLFDKWNIDLDLVYKSSKNCQAKNNAYNGNVTQDEFNNALAYDKNPGEVVCMYSLPVIYIPSNAAGATGKSPCGLIGGTKDDKGSKAGYTYLPARLQKTFGEDEFCNSHCVGRNCTCNNKPNCAGTEDLAKRGPMRIDRFYGET